MKTEPSIRIVGRGGKVRPAQQGRCIAGVGAGLGQVICKVRFTCLCQSEIDGLTKAVTCTGDGDDGGETIGGKLENEWVEGRSARGGLYSAGSDGCQNALLPIGHLSACNAFGGIE